MNYATKGEEICRATSCIANNAAKQFTTWDSAG